MLFRSAISPTPKVNLTSSSSNSVAPLAAISSQIRSCARAPSAGLNLEVLGFPSLPPPARARLTRAPLGFPASPLVRPSRTPLLPADDSSVLPLVETVFHSRARPPRP